MTHAHYHIVWLDRETGQEYLDTVPWTSAEKARQVARDFAQGTTEKWRIMSFAANTCLGASDKPAHHATVLP